jgi:hypothetical protein
MNMENKMVLRFNLIFQGRHHWIHTKQDLLNFFKKK